MSVFRFWMYVLMWNEYYKLYMYIYMYLYSIEVLHGKEIHIEIQCVNIVPLGF